MTDLREAAVASLREMPAALEGFVGADGTIWQIVSVDAAP